MYLRRPGASGPTALDKYMPENMNRISIPRNPAGGGYGRRPDQFGITPMPGAIRDYMDAGGDFGAAEKAFGQAPFPTGGPLMPPENMPQAPFPTGGPLRYPAEDYAAANPPGPSTGFRVPGESRQSGRILGDRDRKFYDEVRQMIQSGRPVGQKRMNRFEGLEDRRVSAGRKPMRQNMLSPMAGGMKRRGM